jgi:hypothetical protein
LQLYFVKIPAKDLMKKWEYAFLRIFWYDENKEF